VATRAEPALGLDPGDAAYGARPLKRTIQKYVQDPLAEMLLEGKVHDGQTIKVTANKDGLIVNGQVVKQAA
jgi:ATP-dependent Clp protease ATP-binding subunit ClpB